MQRSDFGKQFAWGVSTAAFQIEGAPEADGKTPSIWDRFTQQKGRIRHDDHARVSCDFYHRYAEDIALIKKLNIPNFRFSVSWPRILPQGYGKPNARGIDFYNRIIDHCLEKDIIPWLTLYHWDLPDILQQKGGWPNRDILSWFAEYSNVCARYFGDRVKHWMVMNEPLVFTGAGYFLGIHAPGKKSLKAFLAAAHHAALCLGIGSRILRAESDDFKIGSTFSCSHIDPLQDTEKDKLAARRMDALLNRFFIEPALGMGYPVDTLPWLKRIERFMKPGDENMMQADLDFFGLQNYTREVVTHSALTPFVKAKIIPAHKRTLSFTQMNWEVYPEALYQMLHQFAAYPGIKEILVTENGAAFPDKCTANGIEDGDRIRFLNSYLDQVLKAKREGVPVNGYFIWTLLDNFEWAEGYLPKFGLVACDPEKGDRIIKASGYWYRDLLNGHPNGLPEQKFQYEKWEAKW